MALSQVIHARKLDLNDIEMLPVLITAELETGDAKKFEAAYTAADTQMKIAPTDANKLLLARASLETGRISKAYNLLVAVYENRGSQLDAENAYLLYAVYKQNGQKEDGDKYLALALKANPDIKKDMHLWLEIKPLSTMEQAREEAAEKNKQVVEKRQIDTDVQIKQKSYPNYNLRVDGPRARMQFINTNSTIPALKQPSDH